MLCRDVYGVIYNLLDRVDAVCFGLTCKTYWQYYNYIRANELHKIKLLHPGLDDRETYYLAELMKFEHETCTLCNDGDIYCTTICVAYEECDSVGKS